MNETLKGVAHIGAELAAVKADLQREMERHRKTWRQLEQVLGLLRSALPHACHRRDIQDLDTPDGYAYASGLQLLIDNIDAALSQQTEQQTEQEPEQSVLAEALETISRGVKRHFEQGKDADMATLSYWSGIAGAALSATPSPATAHSHD